MGSKYEFNAPVTIGAITGDNASIANAVGAVQNNVQGAQEALALLAGLLPKSVATDGELEHGINLVATARERPSKITLEKVVGWMKSVKEGGAYALVAGHEFQQIYEKLQAVLPHLPS